MYNRHKANCSLVVLVLTCIFFFLLGPDVLAMEKTWKFETVDPQRHFDLYRFSPRFIAIDNNNYPHFVYGGDHLYHSYFDGNNPHYEIVDPAEDVGHYAAIAIGHNGVIHISYYDYKNDRIEYITNAGGSWKKGLPEQFEENTKESSIAVDINGIVHFVYFDYSQNVLKYLKYSNDPNNVSIENAVIDPNFWEENWIDPNWGSEITVESSIAIDSSNTIHISSYHPVGGELLYASNKNGSWEIEIVDPNEVVWGSSIAIDPNDAVFISYYGTVDSELKYVTDANGVWESNPIDTGGFVYAWNSIAVDAMGRVHMSCYDLTNSDLKYATNRSGAWEITTIDSSGTESLGGSIAVDHSGSIHISYLDTSGVALRYATDSPGSWITRIIDTSKKAGRFTSIDYDSSGNIHISYRDLDGKTLKCASYEDDRWAIVILDTDETGDYHNSITSIAVDSSDSIHISYYDAAHMSIKYATNRAGLWHKEVIATDAGSESYNSITLDSLGFPHISYYTGGERIGYVFNKNGIWQKADPPLDYGEDVGQYNSIALDANDRAHISYYDSSNKDLIYANTISGLLESQVVDSQGDVGMYSCIAIDSGGKKHITYYDDTSKTLKYANKLSGAWELETLDANCNAGRFNSIAVDFRDYVHISYYDETDGNLKYASNITGSWKSEVVDSAGDVGWDTSIAVDADYTIHISYFDKDNQNLKYATAQLSPYVTVEPSQRNFGKIIIGESDIEDIKVSNKGTADLEIVEISLGDTNLPSIPFRIQNLTPKPPLFLRIEEDLTFNVVFEPKSEGQFGAQILIISKDTKRPRLTVQLKGEGTLPVISISSDSMDFGELSIQDPPIIKQFTIKSEGSGDLKLGQISITGGNVLSFSIQDDESSNNVLPPGGSSTFNVAFSPESEGSKSASVTVPSNDPDTPTLILNLKGVGTTPLISVSPESKHFGSFNVGVTSKEQVFTVSSIGTADLRIASVLVKGSDRLCFRIVEDNCSGKTLATGTDATIIVDYTALGRGFKRAYLEISSNDPTFPILEVPLIGEGIKKSCFISAISE